MSKIIPATFAAKPEDYKHLGIAPGVPALWEDGLRTDGSAGSFEWWYFDSKLDDGSSLVIIFFTGPMSSKKMDGFEPHCNIELTRPNGGEYKRFIHVNANEAVFAKDRCNVEMRPCYFRGDLHHYEIHFQNGEVEATVTLTSNAPAWRPHTGHIYFGEKDFFAWLPSVPEGTVEAEIIINGKSERHTGTGYHDHNWGNAPMMKLMHHWYWGRAKIGDYQVITSYIYGAKKYGYAEFPIFMLAKDGKVLADDAEKYLKYSEEQPYREGKTGKTVHGALVYEYNDGSQHYRITYHRESDLACGNMTASMPWWKRTVARRLMGLDPSYHRMAGTAILERFEGERIVETVSDPAIWEQMYFGLNRQ